ncbi:alpha/beta fold hydrolase [Flavobacterium sp. Sd200]|uniref:alpha/beta hydrolase n=1 Tax=Flavobacterium sp. Sd200 TaxID=2692211 RepID=UPI001371EF0B|nr:alpha/beta fold hydrolase [Flavobacterium sp. Sd200]MXN90071.1 alpha/beta fold hydrolase [Flavobacterium sp. Sd200]
MKKWLRRFVIAVCFCIGLHLIALVFLYFKQEKFLFHPEVLAKDYKFEFPGNYEEVYIPVDKGVNLHGILFKAQNPKGLVFYLHGNGGSVGGRGVGNEIYTDLGYDLFILDYRGYGKSGGHIQNEDQLVNDVKKAYSYVLGYYHFKEDNTIIAGYSIGTGPATLLAQNKNCKALILQAPYYSLTALIDEKVPLVPEFIKRYRLETYKNLKSVKAPVYIFHGTDDKLIPYSHALKIREYNKKVSVIPLPGAAHNGMNENELFRESLKNILLK